MDTFTSSSNLSNYVNEIPKDIPKDIDWREKGAVNDVIDQKKCGSFWAFSAVTSIEGITQIETGNLLQLSQQQLIDCDKCCHGSEKCNNCNQGCTRGFVYKAFDYVIKNGGLALYDDYPYAAMEGPCRNDTLERFGKISGYIAVPPDESSLQQAVTKQPVSAMVALCPAFYDYKGGIFEGPCQFKLPYEWHSINVIGYGTERDGRKFWIIKNSWGKDWGENGFMRMRMHGQGENFPWGLCGIACYAVYPTIQPN